MSASWLDPRTLGIAIDLVSLCVATIALLLWRSKQMYPGFGRWTFARVVGSLTILFALQLRRFPDLILFADTTAIVSSLLSLEACRQFLKLKPVAHWTYAVGGILIVQLSLVQVFLHSPQASYVEVTFVLGLIHAWSGTTLLRRLPMNLNRGRLIAGFVFLCRSVIDVARTLHFAGNPNSTLLDPSAMTLVFLIADLVYEIVLNFTFFLMHYDRVLADKAEEVSRATSANSALTELKGHLEERVRQRTSELVRSQKLESVARLAAGVAHDFNNILMVINGYSALLLRELHSEDPIYEPVAQIGKAGERAAGITRQLLAFSRQQKDNPQTISGNSLLQGMMDMLHRLIGEDVEIDLRPGERAGDIKADKGQIEQVVMNLAINARDAMPGGGKLLIETSRTAVADDFGADCVSVPPGDYFVISVADTGVGMTPEIQASIFEPFFTTKGHKGTGLGLSTTYGIVTQSGGCITVQSKPGLGSTFRVYLPVAEAAHEESDAELTMVSHLDGSETVLVVEDQADVRSFIREVLRSRGYHALEAAGGAAAVTLALRNPSPIQLLISDVVLPQMSGPEVAKRLRFIHPEIGVLMISGYPAERLEGQLDENVPYLQKPFTAEKLLRQIREILDVARVPR